MQSQFRDSSDADGGARERLACGRADADAALERLPGHLRRHRERASQLNAAISVCTRVLGRNDLSPNTRAELLVHRGVAYRNVGDLDKSLTDLGAAQDLTPDDPWVSRILAWTYREMGRLVDAEKEYGRALTLEPHPQAYLSRCFVRYDMKKLEDALPTARRRTASIRARIAHT